MHGYVQKWWQAFYLLFLTFNNGCLKFRVWKTTWTFTYHANNSFYSSMYIHVYTPGTHTIHSTRACTYMYIHLPCKPLILLKHSFTHQSAKTLFLSWCLHLTEIAPSYWNIISFMLSIQRTITWDRDMEQISLPWGLLNYYLINQIPIAKMGKDASSKTIALKSNAFLRKPEIRPNEP